jgi:hypothetical protein
VRTLGAADENATSSFAALATAARDNVFDNKGEGWASRSSLVLRLNVWLGTLSGHLLRLGQSDASTIGFIIIVIVVLLITLMVLFFLIQKDHWSWQDDRIVTASTSRSVRIPTTPISATLSAPAKQDSSTTSETVVALQREQTHMEPLCPDLMVAPDGGTFTFNIGGLLESCPQEGMVEVQDVRGHAILQAKFAETGYLKHPRMMFLEMAKGKQHTIAVLDMSRTFGEGASRSVSILYGQDSGPGKQYATVEQMAPGHPNQCAFVVRRFAGPTAAAEQLPVLMHVFSSGARYEFVAPNGSILAISHRRSPSLSVLDVAAGADASAVLCAYFAAIKLK